MATIQLSDTQSVILSAACAREGGLVLPITASLKPREGTKQEALIAMLKRPEGASIVEIMEATAWQAHSIRGFIAGALKKKLGLNVTSEKIEGRGRDYKLDSAV
ncbi:DUF3489 domain-containing protein [Magnetospirillum sp. XM-1]|uniref:DUF3489 domain-containing protein n=1 Tax=Magnetospirillum sp. XM-1 TaxID=1663591 RepID=UPI0009E89F6E|nr:DUF3489 domain-containing protein [Magnetospirillum sp. XM-1]